MSRRILFAELREGFDALATERKAAASRTKLGPICTKREYRATLKEIWAL